MSKPIIQSYKGSRVLFLNPDNDGYPFSFGLQKAKLILANLEEIRAFVASNGKNCTPIPQVKMPTTLPVSYDLPDMRYPTLATPKTNAAPPIPRLCGTASGFDPAAPINNRPAPLPPPAITDDEPETLSVVEETAKQAAKETVELIASTESFDF